jgi:hypothetical protein
MEGMHKKLARLTRSPDILIVYAGHNEFSSRHNWADGWAYYLDDRALRGFEIFEAITAAISPLCRTIQDAVRSQRVDAPPPSWITRKLVDVPIYTPEEYRLRKIDFRDRLNAIAQFGRQSGAITILVTPPANDSGYEPNRSFLSPETPRAKRDLFVRDFQRARQTEATDPQASLSQYEKLLAQQPLFAELHYRIARILEAQGKFQEAYHHDTRARDLDGLPMRCPSDFQAIYHDVAANQGALLIDGQTLFHTQSLNGLLDDHLFNDAMHPSLTGHLGQGRFGKNSGSGPALALWCKVDPARFGGMGAFTWNGQRPMGGGL